jgi:SAM-dependent methyltransferase
VSELWDAAAERFDDEPDHGLRDPSTREAWRRLLLDPAAYDVVLCRHVLWALPDQAAALRRWTGLLRPGGRLVLVEGSWHTGAGLAAARTEALLRSVGREPHTVQLSDDVYWGGPITDERYLVVA